MNRKPFYYQYCVFGLCFVTLAITPVIIKRFKEKISDIFGAIIDKNKETDLLFLILGLSCAILFGAVVPFNVVSISPTEFSYIGDYVSPFGILIFPILQAFGVFVFWPLCIAKMFSKQIRNFIIILIGSVLFCAVINIFVFSIKYGSLTSILTLENASSLTGFNPTRESFCILSNIFIIILFIVLLKFRKNKLIINSASVLLLSGILFTGYNGIKIQKEFLDYKKIQSKTTAASGNIAPFIKMTKKGKNVVVIMLDRAIGAFLPIIFENKPELKKSFDGFVFYPNTVSYSSHTITAAAPLYGGYEYTPEMQNLKPEKMVDKHNEAIFMLPKLFMKNNWRATMADAPLVDYKWVADPDKFKKEGIEYDNLIGKYATKYKFENTYQEEIDDAKILIHNFLFYSFMSGVPINNRTLIYQGGKYWNAYLHEQGMTTNIKTGINNYSALFYLPKMTDASADKNSFFFLQNELTHVDFNLEYPDFTPNSKIKNIGTNLFHDSKTYMRYQTTMAAMILISKWLDKLKELEIYNNTRIILTSDHGIEVKLLQFDNFLNTHVTPYNPLLLMKDFNAKGEIKENHEFMTSADVPYYATLGVVDQTNPFTNKKLTTSPKSKGVNILLDFKRIPEEFRGTRCIDPKSKMWHVKNDIMNKKNWSDIKPKI